MPYTYITSYVLYWKENLASQSAGMGGSCATNRPDRALLVMVKSFASYELCMAFLVELCAQVCVCVVPKVDKFTCAQTIMLILKRLTYT